jgi:hypothetical protein
MMLTDRVVLRKAGVVAAVGSAVAVVVLAGGRLWAGQEEPPSLGPSVVVTQNPNSAPSRTPTSRLAPPTRTPTPAASARPSREPAPPASSPLPSEPGGRPVRTMPAPHSTDDDMPSFGITPPGNGEDGGDDGPGDDGDEG